MEKTRLVTKNHPVHIYHMAPLVKISNDAMPGKYEKSYQNSAQEISQLSYVWLGWSGIFVSFLRHIGEYFCVIRVSYHIG